MRNGTRERLIAQNSQQLHEAAPIMVGPQIDRGEMAQQHRDKWAILHDQGDDAGPSVIGILVERGMPLSIGPAGCGQVEVIGSHHEANEPAALKASVNHRWDALAGPEFGLIKPCEQTSSLIGFRLDVTRQVTDELLIDAAMR